MGRGKKTKQNYSQNNKGSNKSKLLLSDDRLDSLTSRCIRRCTLDDRMPRVSISEDNIKILLEIFQKIDSKALVPVVQQKNIAIVSDLDTSSSTSHSESEEVDNDKSEESFVMGEEDKVTADNKKLAVEAVTTRATKNKWIDHQYIRKLIRDDRRVSKEMEIDKEKSSLNSWKLRNNQPDAECSIECVSPALTQNFIPLDSMVHVQLICASKHGTKLMSFSRHASLEDICHLARNKFTVGKKFDKLLIYPEKYLLTQNKITSILKDTTLCLSDILPQVTDQNKLNVPIDGDKIEIQNEIIAKVKDSPLPSSPSITSSSSEIEESTTQFSSIWRRPQYTNIPTFTPRIICASTNAALILKQTCLHNKRLELSSTEGTSATFISLQQQQQLPIYQYQTEILSLLANHQIILIAGAPGCGKTTQVPQFILDDMISASKGSEANIICTQPRRIAAVTVAERVAFERSEGIGETVGYQIRLNSRCSSETRLMYCTTGVLLRKLQSGNDFLTGISHIVIDEVHERQVETDFLLCLMKRHLPNYPHLKLILMSATMQEEMFSTYFGCCPVLRVQGREYPVTLHYLSEAQELIRQTQATIGFYRNSGASSLINPVEERIDSNGNIIRNSKSNENKNNKGKKSINKNTSGQGKATSTTDTSTVSDITDSILSSIKRPKLDPELIGELVIRIIQEYSVFANTSNKNEILSRISIAGQRHPDLNLQSQLEAVKSSSSSSSSSSVSANKHTTTTTSTTTTSKNNGYDTKPSLGQAILVFLPGSQAIDNVARVLRRKDLAIMNTTVHILHGSQTPEQQRKAFQPAFGGSWRVVLSTNVAETSVTLPDVTHVIDCGLHREMKYDPVLDMGCLAETPVSRASARQRAGRAGRVAPGHCWRMYDEEFFSGVIRSSEGINNSSNNSNNNNIQNNMTDSELLEEVKNFIVDQVQPSAVEDFKLDTDKDIPKKSIPETIIFESMDEYPLSEIRRVPLEEIVLQILLLELGNPYKFLEACLESPSKEQINAAVNRLLGIGAITSSSCTSEVLEDLLEDLSDEEEDEDASGENNVVKKEMKKDDDQNLVELKSSVAMESSNFELTALGYHLSRLPMDVRLGKMLLVATILHCLEDALSIAAALGTRSPFIYPPNQKDEAMKAHHSLLKNHILSDHIAIVNVYQKWTTILVEYGREEAYSYCRQKYISHNVLEDIKALREQYRKYLIDAQFLTTFPSGLSSLEVEEDSVIFKQGNTPVPELVYKDTTDSHSNLIRCALYAGLCPNIAKVYREPPPRKQGKKGIRNLPGEGKLNIKQSDGKEVFIHPMSLIHKQVQKLLDDAPVNYLTYHKKVSTTRIYLHDCTEIPVLGAILFGGPISICRNRETISSPTAGGGILRARVKELDGVLIRRLEKELNRLLIHKLETTSTSSSIWLDDPLIESSLLSVLESLVSASD